jgi:hypothetical protein
MTEFCDWLLVNGRGNLGLGDERFGLSLGILEQADKQPGFVKKSNSQFVADHGSICKSAPSFSNFELTTCCEELCGSFCKHDIANPEGYACVDEMQTRIIRLMRDARPVK